jgi:hypothetical protein
MKTSEVEIRRQVLSIDRDYSQRLQAEHFSCSCAERRVNTVKTKYIEVIRSDPSDGNDSL